VARYLVTGGAGFIGSHLAEALLAGGSEVRVLDDLSTGRRQNLPAGVELMVGDVADAAMVARAMAGVDGCFHLAAIASVQRGTEDWLATHRVNQTASIAVFEAARHRHLPVVYASSAAVYGDNPDLPLSEVAATRPLSAYGADKLASELHGRVASLVHGVPTIGLRFFNVFGPRQDPASPYSGVIAIFANRIAAGQGVTLFGDGGQERDFIYVADVVAHLTAAMARLQAGAPGGEVFNVCGGGATTIRQLAQAIADLTGSPLLASEGPARAGDIRRSRGDPARARQALGVGATVTLVEGLRRTLEWMRELPSPRHCGQI
jgi:UDP-glucose 4-epimerase